MFSTVCVCISSGAVSQALNSICTFPLMLRVRLCAGESGTGRADLTVHCCLNVHCDVAAAPQVGHNLVTKKN